MTNACENACLQCHLESSCYFFNKHLCTRYISANGCSKYTQQKSDYNKIINKDKTKKSGLPLMHNLMSKGFLLLF